MQSPYLIFCCALVLLSSSRLRKVWQRRKCSVKGGMLTISHATVRGKHTTHTHTRIHKHTHTYGG